MAIKRRVGIMLNRDLSILIPARNEEWLGKTIEDILKNIEADTEIIVVADGALPVEPIPQHERVTIILLQESIGQRAAQNMACRLSKAKYVMKMDAHCKVDKGFDRKMLEAFKESGDNVTMVPVMKNLHVFNWVCKECGTSRYQGKSGKCEKCEGEEKRDIVWKEKKSPNSTSYQFDRTLHFQYYGQYKKEQKGDLVESMSLQGSCFMLTRENYWKWNVCDETWGSWGNQGTEVACKTWFNGGRVLCNKLTWYAHLFRTQGGDFGHPYPQSGRQVEAARQKSRDLFFNWEGERNLSWLVDKFKAPDFSKGIIYYTDNQLNLKIAHKVQKLLKEIGLPIYSASLKPMPHFGNNNVVNLKRGIEAYFTQILTALNNCPQKIVFFCEHDVLYNKSHFDFIPPTIDKFYFNTNVWKVDWETGKALWTDNLQQVSGMVCYKDLAIDHYTRKLEHVKTEKFNRRFEPETKTGNLRVSYQSREPIYDIRHNNNLTPSRWSKNQFKNQKYTKGWKEKVINMK